MKKKCDTRLLFNKRRKKLYAIMRIFAFIMLVLSMHLSANTYSQEVRMSLDLKDVKLKQVFNKIKSETEFGFFYNMKDLTKAGNVNVVVKNATIESIMNKVLEGSGLGYRIINKTIIVKPKVSDDKKKDGKKELKGIVKDENGSPVPGVTVIVKGTNVGVATDVKGGFTIKVNKGDIIVVSFVGMKKQEIKIKDFKDLKIEMLQDREELDEVVITGYEVINKRHLASSVKTLKAKDIIEPIVAGSVESLLQGKVPGMNVMNQSSTPGAAPKIRIRGSSSISGNREPVWVIDGIIQEDPVPVSAEELNSMDKVNFIGNAISFLNPEDIERIDVLKDASATAIYGSKAANGVIVITTKKGKRGKAKVSYTASASIINRPSYDVMHRMNSKDRIEVSEEMHERGLTFSSFIPSKVAYDDALMDLWDRKITNSEFNARVKQLKETNTDWYDLLFRNSFSNSHNVSISGATDDVNYYFSAGYTDQKGATLGVQMKKYNVLMKLTNQLTKDLRVSINLSTASTESDRPHHSVDLFEYAYNTSRAIAPYDEDENRFFYAAEKSYGDDFLGIKYDPITYNIFNELDNSGSKTKNKSIAATFNIDWNISKILKYRATVNVNKSTSDTENWFSEQSFAAQKKRQLPYGADFPTGQTIYKYLCQLPVGGEISTGSFSRTSYMFRNSINLNKSFNKHYFNAHVGFEARSTKNNGLNVLGLGYLPDRGKKFAKVNLEDFPAYANRVNWNDPILTDTETNFMSYYGTFTYSFDNKYTLNFNVRADGSNKFGQDKSTRFLPIWSVSTRWNIIEESIFDNVTFLNDLAIKASYGVQGNVSPDQIPDLILTMSGKDDVAGEYYSRLSKFPNENLKWEKTNSYNLGLDFSLFKNRLNGTVEVYKKKGKDQIVSKRLTGTNGTDQFSINEGTIENKGWELMLNATLIKTKNLQWGMSFNTAKNYNKITDAGDNIYTYEDYLNGSIVSNGNAVNTFYSYKFGGLDKNGLPTFKDYEERDSNGKFLYTSYEAAYRHILAYSGNREPDLTGGFSTFFRYKKLSINAIFAFSVGKKERLNDLYKSSGQTLPYPQQNMSDEFVNRWRKSGDEKFTNIPALSDESLAVDPNEREFVVSNNFWQMYNDSDLRVVSADFLRCRNLSINYSFDLKSSQNIGIKSLNMSLSVANLFVLKSKKLRGRDPEQIKLGAGSIPPQKTYSIRLTANF